MFSDLLVSAKQDDILLLLLFLQFNTSKKKLQESLQNRS